MKNLSKKFHNQKGLTGADVALALAIIVLTVGVVSAIYINTTNKSKESVRYSAATRIATQIVENIQSMTYDEVVYRCDNDLNTSSSTEDRKIFGVSVPSGYSATVTANSVSGDELDIIRDITVNVNYTVSNTPKTIALYTTKQKELLEQTNSPDLSELEGYSSDNYYAIKYTGSNYVVTATSDSEWYNYDEGNYALIFYSSNNYSYGSTISSGVVKAGTVYAWIPRFGLDSGNLAYCYGTSSYKINFSLYNNSLYGYMLSGVFANDEYTVNSISAYASNTFTANDGLTGVWYEINGTNEQLVKNIYTSFSSLNSPNNF